MRFSSVVFVGHDDGGLLALKATERIQASPDSSKVNFCSIHKFVCPILAVLLVTLEYLSSMACGCCLRAYQAICHSGSLPGLLFFFFFFAFGVKER
jgi:hypothetical protein